MTDPIKALIAAADRVNEVWTGSKEELSFFHMQQLREAVRAAKDAAEARPEPKPEARNWEHAANEWADAATNVPAMLDLIEIGQMTIAEAREANRKDCERARSTQPSRPELAAEPDTVEHWIGTALYHRSVGDMQGTTACILKAVKALAREVRR